MDKTTTHPVHNVYDGLFNSASGGVISLINPTADQIRLRDMAKALSNICRFGGQIEEFFSVAKHTLLVWYLAPAHLKQAALLHDTPEACGLGDAIKPFKVLIQDVYTPFEDLFAGLIFKKYNVDISLLPAIKPYDMAATGLEHNYHRNDDRYIMKVFRGMDELLPEGTPFDKLYYLFMKEFGQYDE